MGFLALKTTGAAIVTTPSVLKALQGIRLKMQSGKSVSTSIEAAAASADDPFLKALKIWKVRMDLGQDSVVILDGLPELRSTMGRRALMTVLEKGLRGAPIDDYLGELEKEFYLSAENSFDKHLQILPMKMMAPLMLLILPGIMLLLIAPLLFTVGQGF